jgi:hypothetical protein
VHARHQPPRTSFYARDWDWHLPLTASRKHPQCLVDFSRYI